jgi:TolB protein
LRRRAVVLLGMSLLLIGAAAWPQAIQIGSSLGSSRLQSVAVPPFAAAPGLEAIAQQMSEAAAFDLTFTGLFEVQPASGYPPAFRGYTADPTEIDFAAWRAAKVNYLVYAFVRMEGDALIAECRLFDVATSTQTVGQRLSSDRGLPRLVAHRFSDEIVRAIDGVPGIATSEICFSGGSTGNKEIYVADYDGANARAVTQHKSISIKPKISPDGTKIAYVSFKDRYPFLYILDRATGKSSALSKSVGLNSSPAWSPDGRTLALTLSKDGNTEIYLKNPDGSGERRLTHERAADTSPAFDPSGKFIAFVSERGGSPQIHVMDADGGNVRRLSYQGGNAYDPAWSPDGRMIAYVAELPGQGLEIYVMASDGTDPRQLTNTAGSNESPSWSADSRHVIFSSTRSGKSELWAVNIGVPNTQHRIAAGNMTCEGPSWGPRR